MSSNSESTEPRRTKLAEQTVFTFGHPDFHLSNDPISDAWTPAFDRPVAALSDRFRTSVEIDRDFSDSEPGGGISVARYSQCSRITTTEI
ncbi:hypothetical protein RRG08_010077 [Elysia crispata]|uniref:Uncharacterized protein n=1 Tax=Elysia crispata TaxID=231223 RepID=A0AAE1EC34_9GAST|nr:hypothetical protein RRG08_010077 [Elysia crispata]